MTGDALTPAFSRRLRRRFPFLNLAEDNTLFESFHERRRRAGFVRRLAAAGDLAAPGLIVLARAVILVWGVLFSLGCLINLILSPAPAIIILAAALLNLVVSYLLFRFLGRLERYTSSASRLPLWIAHVFLPPIKLLPLQDLRMSGVSGTTIIEAILLDLLAPRLLLARTAAWVLCAGGALSVVHFAPRDAIMLAPLAGWILLQPLLSRGLQRCAWLSALSHADRMVGRWEGEAGRWHGLLHYPFLFVVTIFLVDWISLQVVTRVAARLLTDMADPNFAAVGWSYAQELLVLQVAVALWGTFLFPDYLIRRTIVGIYHTADRAFVAFADRVGESQAHCAPGTP